MRPDNTLGHWLERSREARQLLKGSVARRSHFLVTGGAGCAGRRDVMERWPPRGVWQRPAPAPGKANVWGQEGL